MKYFYVYDDEDGLHVNKCDGTKLEDYIKNKNFYVFKTDKNFVFDEYFKQKYSPFKVNTPFHIIETEGFYTVNINKLEIDHTNFSDIINKIDRYESCLF